MKILLVTEFFPTGKDLKYSGGVESRTYFLARHLAKKHKVYVLCTRQKGTKEREVYESFTVLRVGPPLPYDSGVPSFFAFPKRLIFMFNAINAGRELKPDIVDGGNFVAHFIAKSIARDNIPSVYWYPDVFIGQWFKTSGLIGGMLGFILERLNNLRSPDHYIAISKTTSKKLQKIGVPVSDISVIYCGVERSEFSQKIKKTKSQTILCISRLTKYKRVKDLILAYALSLKEFPKINLTIVGNGPEKRELLNLINAINLSEKIIFKENLPRKELIQNLKEAKLLVLPSEVEGFGIVIIEALAANTPYVASNIEVIKEITREGMGGLLYKTGNVRQLSSQMNKLISDNKLYAKSQREGRELSREYSWSDIARKTESVYRRLVK